MQLTIVGGGGFRVPAMIDVLAHSRSGQGAYASLDVDRVVLYDTDARRLDAMMAVLASLDFPHSPAVRATTDIDEALPGADFVFSAMRVGGTCGRVLAEHGTHRPGDDPGRVREVDEPGARAQALGGTCQLECRSERAERVAIAAHADGLLPE